MTSTPSLLDVQDAHIQSAIENIHTCMPCEVVRLHEGEHKRQFVDVLPSLMRAAVDEDGEDIDEDLPIIPMVPVAYMQGGGFFISMPLAVGDIVTVIFAERSLDQWIETARKGGGRAINPGDVSTHSFEGAIALPCGPAPRSALLANVSATDLVIGKDGSTRIHIAADGVVHIGDGSGEDFPAHADKVTTELNRIKTDIDSLKTAIIAGLTGVGESSAASGTAAKEAFNLSLTGKTVPSSPGDVAATKLKLD